MEEHEGCPGLRVSAAMSVQRKQRQGSLAASFMLPNLAHALERTSDRDECFANSPRRVAPHAVCTA